MRRSGLLSSFSSEEEDDVGAGAVEDVPVEGANSQPPDPLDWYPEEQIVHVDPSVQASQLGFEDAQEEQAPPDMKYPVEHAVQTEMLEHVEQFALHWMQSAPEIENPGDGQVQIPPLAT